MGLCGTGKTPSPVLKRLARADDLDDMITQVMTAACGVTINCARCHDHKLDPITQDEYYGLWAVFSGVKRADRLISAHEEEQLQSRRRELSEKLKAAHTQLSMLRGDGLSLADIVSGGDGYRNGSKNNGIDPLTGNIQTEKRGFLDGAIANRFLPSSVRFVDGVVIPNGGNGPIPISSTGLTRCRTAGNISKGVGRCSQRSRECSFFHDTRWDRLQYRIASAPVAACQCGNHI